MNQSALLDMAERKQVPATRAEMEQAINFSKRFVASEALEEAFAVVVTLLNFAPDHDTLIAALLLKCADIAAPPFVEIETEFGAGVRRILEQLQRLSRFTHIALENPTKQPEVLRKMFLALAGDIRVVFIKLANRCYTLEHIKRLAPELQKLYPEEVLVLYAPIAARLGIYRLKRELEDRAFALLLPREYKRIKAQIQKVQKKQGKMLENGQAALEKILAQARLAGTVQSRIKDPYSLYQKLRRKEMTDLESVHDLFAFRIVVESIPDCYNVLGLIHQHWSVISGRFKDYIATPKPNGYQSLHTTIMGTFVPGKSAYPVEVQIRTTAMHEACELGSAVHWRYKENEKTALQKNWFAELARASRSLKNAHSFDLFAYEFLEDKIFVITEKGDIKVLPEGATPLDFAFAVHSDVGLHCHSAVVNGVIVPLHTKLNHGDTVKILTKKNSWPRASWLNIVASPGTRQKIRAFLARNNQPDFIRQGKEKLNAVLQELGVGVLDRSLSLLKNYSASTAASFRIRETILQRIGNGDMSAVAVAKKIAAVKTEYFGTGKNLNASPSKEDIFIGGEGGYRIKMAKCCAPIKKEAIIAFITRGGSCTIHRQTCRTIKKLDPDRIFPASWE